MKKSLIFKIALFSFLVNISANSFSENPTFDKGDGVNSTIAGIKLVLLIKLLENLVLLLGMVITMIY